MIMVLRLVAGKVHHMVGGAQGGEGETVAGAGCTGGVCSLGSSQTRQVLRASVSSAPTDTTTGSGLGLTVTTATKM